MSGLTPANSSITTDAEFEKAVMNASFEEVKALMQQRSVDQGLVRRDIYDPNVLHEVEPGAQTAYAKTVTINGVDHQVSGTTEAEMLRSESALFQGLFEKTATAAVAAPARDESGRFVAADPAEVAAKSELLLKFQLGQIDAATYLEQSGAITEYLEKAGVPLAELQAAVQDKSSQRIEQSWAAATQEFLNTDEGSIWVGGEANKNKLGEVLIAMGAADAPNAENIRLAAKYLRENNMLVENPELAQHQRIEGAKSREELDIALGRSSSLWR
jgi:hypothetical protein